MNTLQKVVWSEGVCLSQQHLQQQEYYFQKLQQCYWQWSQPQAWGLKQWSYDIDKLSMGCFEVTYCEAIMSNGMPLVYQKDNDALLQLDVTHFKDDVVSVFIAVPLNTYCQNIPGYEAGNFSAAWQAKALMVADEYDAMRHSEIIVAKQTPRLLTQHACLDTFSVIKMAELIRMQQGGYQVDTGFIASCLCCKYHNGLSDKIQTIHLGLNTVLGELAKSSAHHELRRWLQQQGLHLKMLYASKVLAPITLYQCLASIYLSLCDLYDAKITMSFMYDFEGLTECFNPLVSEILNMLQKPLPLPWQRYELTQSGNGFYIENIIFSKQYYYILEVQSSVDIEKQIKITTAKNMPTLLSSAISGIKIKAMMTNTLPFKAKDNYSYWKLMPNEQQWAQLSTEKNVSIFIPDTLEIKFVNLLRLES